MDEEPNVPPEAEEPEEAPRLATLGEILEAHHRRFVEKVRKQKEQGE